MRRVTLLLMTLSWLSGCASVVRFELPDELKGKKLKEDPPISMLHRPSVEPIEVSLWA